MIESKLPIHDIQPCLHLDIQPCVFCRRGGGEGGEVGGGGEGEGGGGEEEEEKEEEESGGRPYSPVHLQLPLPAWAH